METDGIEERAGQRGGIYAKIRAAATRGAAAGLIASARSIDVDGMKKELAVGRAGDIDTVARTERDSVGYARGDADKAVSRERYIGAAGMEQKFLHGDMG